MSWQMPGAAGQWPPAMAMPQDMNMGSYTPEQWAILQQQNWQQWQQWQQYAQWQSQYDEKYVQQLQAGPAMVGMPPLPISGGAPPVPPPPDQPPPPPPPHENNQPLYGNVAQPTTGSALRNTSNFSNTDPKTGINQRSYDSEAPKEPPSTINKEALKKLAEEEKSFDIQFQKWEEEIERWRQENVNHPDRRAYQEYEERFELCRAQLLERRKQMQMKRDRLLNPTNTVLPPANNPTGNVPQPAPPSQNTPINYNQSGGQAQTFQNNTYQKDYNTQPMYNKQRGNNKNIDPQDRFESYNSIDNSDLHPQKDVVKSDPATFLPTTSAGKSIPGLDLVPDSSQAQKPQDIIDITDDNTEMENAPDYSKISKGINNILGDAKIMNILSMVKGQNIPPSNTGQNVPANTPSNAPPSNNQTFLINQGNKNQSSCDQNQQYGNRQNMPYNRQGPNFPMQQNQGMNSQQQGMYDDGGQSMHGQYGDRNTPYNRGPDMRQGVPGMKQGGPDLRLGAPHMRQGGTDMRQGGPDMRQGGLDMRQGRPDIRPVGPDMRQGGPDMRQGGLDMRQGGPDMRPGGPDMRQGRPDIRQGGPDMRQGGQGMRQGGQGMRQGGMWDGGNMSSGGQDMRQGGPDMRSGGPSIQQGAPNLRQGGGAGMQQGGPNMRQGGPDMRQGGPDMRQGGPDMRQGGPDMRQGGPDMRQGGPDMRQGGVDMRQGGPDMRYGGPEMKHDMRQGVPNLRQGGPDIRQAGPNIRQGGSEINQGGHNMLQDMRRPGPNNQADNNGIPPLMNFNSRPPLQDMSSQQNVDDYYGPERPTPVNNPSVTQPPRPKWVEEPLFTPSLVVDYEHKPLRLKAREFIEPVHTFDYNHRSKDEDLNKKKDFEREVDELFTRMPRREEPEDRYVKDLYYRDYERRGPREDVRDIRDTRDYRDSRNEFRDTRGPRGISREPLREDFERRRDDRYDDRRREDIRDSRRDDVRDLRRDDMRDLRREDVRDLRRDDMHDLRRDDMRDLRRDDMRDLRRDDMRELRRDDMRDMRRDDMRDLRRDDRRDDRDRFHRRDDIRERDRDTHRARDDRASDLPRDDRVRDPPREDRSRDIRRDDPKHRSKSKESDTRKRGLSKENENITEAVPVKKAKDITKERKHIVMIDDLLEPPGREMRPEKLVIILRGLPGSGKSYLAKLIRDREAEHGGTARIMSIDDYFMQEGETEEKDPQTGKMVKKPFLKYEYDESAEESYLTSLKRAFKRSLTDGYFNFLIYDAVNEQLKHYADIWNYARQCGFQVYICTMEMDIHTCFKRNIHNRKLEDLEILKARFFETPSHHIELDATTLLQSASIQEVTMEDVEDDVIMEDVQEAEVTEVESVFTSKWEKMDDAVQLARLDGTSKPLRPSQPSMADYLQLDEWKPNVAKPGKKTVRWADIEEKREQEKLRAIGFVVGQTDWNRMNDPTMGSSALTQTKYIERVRRH